LAEQQEFSRDLAIGKARDKQVQRDRQAMAASRRVKK
jgi:hypothetical protein